MYSLQFWNGWVQLKQNFSDLVTERRKAQYESGKKKVIRKKEIKLKN